jgi:GMP synthase (glutamine-hydrolysing)
VIGICFGHQIIARALGAQVGRNEAGWEVSVEKLTLTEAGKKLFGKDTLASEKRKHASKPDFERDSD